MVVQARARPTHDVPRRRAGEPSARDPSRDTGPPGVPVIAEQRAEEQCSHPEAETRERRVQDRRTLDHTAEEEREDRRDGERTKPPGALHEGEIGSLQVDQEVRAGSGSGDKRGEERPDAGGLRKAESLEDVDEKLHAVGYRPSGMTVEDRDRDRGGEREPLHMDARRPSSAARDIERYASLFASRTRVMTSSVMRDLMAITERPEVISLAGGLPDTTSFPPETMAAVMARVASESSARALQYGPTNGLLQTRETVTRVMAASGATADPDDVLITTGGQQVIDLVCKALIDRGDVIVAEGPTYPGAVPAFTAYEADVVQISMDDDGMRIDELEETLDRLEREGRRPKFIYTIPTFQNPGGVTMSLPRRKRLVEVARERELLVLEDDPYGLLRFEGDPLPTLFELDGGEFVIYAGTFSKILSPGVRLGWAVAPRPVLEKLNLGAAESTLCPSSLTQLFVSAYFEGDGWRGYVDGLVDLYRRRRDAMLEALERNMPDGASWTHPQGGLFVWATLPDYIDTTDLLALALSHNVAFVPGRGAYLDGRGGSSMRLNFSGSTEEEIREGVARIGAVVREQIDLYQALTGGPREARRTEPQPRTDLADVLALPRRRDAAARRDAQ